MKKVFLCFFALAVMFLAACGDKTTTKEDIIVEFEGANSITVSVDGIYDLPEIDLTAEKALLNGYQSVADEYDLMISYAGVGFYLAQVNNVNVNLYQSDLTHPSSAGTYLAALIHAGTLFGINPKDVTYVPSFVIEASGGNRIQPTTEDCEAVRNIAYDIIYNLDLSILD